MKKFISIALVMMCIICSCTKEEQSIFDGSWTLLEGKMISVNTNVEAKLKYGDLNIVFKPFDNTVVMSGILDTVIGSYTENGKSVSINFRDNKPSEGKIVNNQLVMTGIYTQVATLWDHTMKVDYNYTFTFTKD